MKNTFVIAEAGANHNRDFRIAVDLINVANLAGASAVKFQTYSSETLYSKHTKDFAFYKDIPSLIKSIELPREWQIDLKSYCDDIGIEFMSTPFDEKAVDELYNLGVSRFKIGAFEATDLRFVKYVASTGLPLIISAGIGVDREMAIKIVDCVRSVNPSVDLTLLHCNSSYPTPICDINLGQMAVLKMANNMRRSVKIGLSDHTEGILIPPIAVALGASCIEKHFTLNRSSLGPDHSFSVDPEDLYIMVKNIRDVEQAIGCKEGSCTNSENDFIPATRSVVCSANLDIGDIISEDNTTTKRPYYIGCVKAIDYGNIIGKRLLVKKSYDEQLLWGDLE